jgi:2-iminobutanoate/2-iminopropanoate deaminase
MQTIVHNPADGIYAATPDYAHALEVRDAKRLLFVAGTMGLDATGTPPASFEEQLELVWTNIRTILGSAGMSVDNIVRATTYLRHAEHAEPNGAARLAALGGRVIPTTAVVVETISNDWLVEVEVVAAA